MHAAYSYGPNRGVLVVTYLVSIAFYGALAFAFFQTCLNRFDIEVDRPRRPDDLGPGAASREGIEFQDPPEESTVEGIEFMPAEEDRKTPPTPPEPRPEGTHPAPRIRIETAGKP